MSEYSDIPVRKKAGVPAGAAAGGAHAKSPREGGLRVDAPPTREGGPARSGGRKKRGRLVKVIIIVVAVVLVGLGATWLVLSHTDLFKIESVQVEGSERLTTDYLTGLIDVEEGTNLLNVDTDSIAERLMSNPWIGAVDIRREFPHTLVINITDADPAATIQIDPAAALGSAQYWLISKDGVWMSQVSSTGVEEARQLVIDATAEEVGASSGAATVVWYDDEGVGYDANENPVYYPEGYFDTHEQPAEEPVAEEPVEERAPSVCVDVYMTVEDLSTVPLVSGVTAGIIPEVGVEETDEGILNALGILSSANEEFTSQIATIEASSDNSTNLMLKNGVEVAFGAATDIESKIQVINDLLEQHAGEITYINVRVVSRPAWRGL